MLEISVKDDSGKKKSAKGGKQKKLSMEEREAEIARLTLEMKNAAKLLEFEHAAYLRDKINKLKEQRVTPKAPVPKGKTK